MAEHLNEIVIKKEHLHQQVQDYITANQNEKSAIGPLTELIHRHGLIVDKHKTEYQHLNPLLFRWTDHDLAVAHNGDLRLIFKK